MSARACACLCLCLCVRNVGFDANGSYPESSSDSEAYPADSLLWSRHVLSLLFIASSFIKCKLYNGYDKG